MATHSSILAWRIPWTEEPGGLQSMGLQRVRHDLATKPPPPEPDIYCKENHFCTVKNGSIMVFFLCQMFANEATMKHHDLTFGTLCITCDHLHSGKDVYRICTSQADMGKYINYILYKGSATHSFFSKLVNLYMDLPKIKESKGTNTVIEMETKITTDSNTVKEE